MSRPVFLVHGQPWVQRQREAPEVFTVWRPDVSQLFRDPEGRVAFAAANDQLVAPTLEELRSGAQTPLEDVDPAAQHQAGPMLP